MKKMPLVALWSLAIVSGLAVVASPVHAAGNAKRGQPKAAACAACHGPDGNSVNVEWPKLAGQHADYLAKQMKDFKTGTRKAVTEAGAAMPGMVAGLSDQDMQDIGAYYAAQKPSGGAARTRELAQTGEKLYRGGNLKTGVAACMSCHGPDGKGVPPRFPRVSGQHAAYTASQMRAFKNAKRTNDGETMTKVAFLLTEQEMRAVSEYMAGLH